MYVHRNIPVLGAKFARECLVQMLNVECGTKHLQGIIDIKLHCITNLFQGIVGLAVRRSECGCLGAGTGAGSCPAAPFR